MAGGAVDLVADEETGRAPTEGVEDRDGGWEFPVPLTSVRGGVALDFDASPKEKVVEATAAEVADGDAAATEAEGATAARDTVGAAAADEIVAEVETADTAGKDPMELDGAPIEADLVSVGWEPTVAVVVRVEAGAMAEEGAGVEASVKGEGAGVEIGSGVEAGRGVGGVTMAAKVGGVAFPAREGQNKIETGGKE